MELPNEEIVGGPGEYTQAIAEEEKPGICAILMGRVGRSQMMFGGGSVRQLTRFPGLPKVWAVFIEKR